MECTKCKLQYVGKVDRPFAQRDHDFNPDTKFPIIEQL